MKNKDFFREKAKIRRNDIINRYEKDCIISQKVVELISGRNIDSLFLYVSMNSEVDTLGIIRELFGKINLYVPFTYESDMFPVPLTDLNSLDKADKLGNIYSKAEVIDYYNKPPIVPSVTLVPLLAFDNSLFRLGYGGGYYDRFLSKVETEKIGLAYDEQQDNEILHDEFDIQLDAMVTPTRTLRR